MPRPVGYGRPDTPVFPPTWSETLAAVETRSYESTVIIGPAAQSAGWDATSRQTVSAAATPAYDGVASIRPPTRDDLAPAQRNVAEDLVRVYDLEVCLPQPTAGIEEGMVCTITASPDGTLIGRSGQVAFVERGDRRFTRLLGITLNS